MFPARRDNHSHDLSSTNAGEIRLSTRFDPLVATTTDCPGVFHQNPRRLQPNTRNPRAPLGDASGETEGRSIGVPQCTADATPARNMLAALDGDQRKRLGATAGVVTPEARIAPNAIRRLACSPNLGGSNRLIARKMEARAMREPDWATADGRVGCTAGLSLTSPPTLRLNAVDDGRD